MIPLPIELKNVETALQKRTMTGNEAATTVYRARLKLGPPWHWKSWKQARATVLGSECKTCGAGKNAILYVQHTFRNPRVLPYIKEAKKKLKNMAPEIDWRPELRNKMCAIRDMTFPEMRECCPVCSSLSIQYRTGAKTWICNSKSTGKYCAHVFDKPAEKSALSAAQKKAIRNEKHEAYKTVVLHREHDYKRDAMLAWIKDLKRYLSLKDTKTLCKRCAFLEDMTDLKPCHACGFAFSRNENVCPDCGEID